MIDIFLRAEDRPAMDAALAAADLIESGACLDRIGTVSIVTGRDADGEPIIETVPGYHVNLRLCFDPSPEQLSALAAVTIAAPSSPFRVWAD